MGVDAIPSKKKIFISINPNNFAIKFLLIFSKLFSSVNSSSNFFPNYIENVAYYVASELICNLRRNYDIPYSCLTISARNNVQL